MQQPKIAPLSTGSPRRQWLRNGLALLIVTGAFAVVAAAFTYLRGNPWVIELTQPELQAELNTRFPMERLYAGVLLVTLSSPTVTLVEGSDRITFGVTTTVDLKIPGQAKQLGGTATISSGLRYEAREYSFYLDDLELEELRLQGIPIEYQEKAHFSVTLLAEEKIEGTRVYTLEKNNLKQAATRLLLQECTVRDGKLIVRLGF